MRSQGEFRVGGGAEGLFDCGGAREEQFWGAKRGERLGEGEAVVKEEADGDEAGSRVVEGDVEEVGAGLSTMRAGIAGLVAARWVASEAPVPVP